MKQTNKKTSTTWASFSKSHQNLTNYTKNLEFVHFNFKRPGLNPVLLNPDENLRKHMQESSAVK